MCGSCVGLVALLAATTTLINAQVVFPGESQPFTTVGVGTGGGQQPHGGEERPSGRRGAGEAIFFPRTPQEPEVRIRQINIYFSLI